MSDARQALAGLPGRAWLVGGAVRDRLLGRPSSDFDVVLEVGDPAAVETAARDLARSAGGFAFALSQAFGAWRVVAHARDWQIDLMAAEGGSLAADLLRRDLTVNAIAEPVAGGELVDPTGGVADLARRRLRAVSDGAFAADALRALRLARLAVELGFTVEPETVALARASAPRLPGVAAERVFAELRRVIAADGALEGLDLMDALGITEAVLPELAALAGVEQSRYHHLDVLGHTRAVLAETIALQADPEAVLGASGAPVAAFLDEPLANELTRGQALRFGALLHDIAKPRTRSVAAGGRVLFMGHDEAGAGMAAGILERLRAGDRVAQYVAALTRHHLRLGFLVHEMPLDRRQVYRYLHDCAPVPVDVTLLSVADRLATRGANAQRAIAAHLELARTVLPAALAWSARPPRAPVRGDALGAALGIAPGPRLGALLGKLTEAAYAGDVASPEEAIAYARRLVADGSEGAAHR